MKNHFIRNFFLKCFLFFPMKQYANKTKQFSPMKQCADKTKQFLPMKQCADKTKLRIGYPLKKMFSVATMVFFISAIISMTLFYQKARTLEEGLFRIHILANSDSAFDQALKLAVRDEVVRYVRENFEAVKDKEELKQKIRSHEHEIIKLIKRIQEKKAIDQTIHLEIVHQLFPTIHYGLYTVPTGTYDALRIKLGKGEGKNWWCVLFPPLCLAQQETVDSKEGQAKEGQTKESQAKEGQAKIGREVALQTKSASLVLLRKDEQSFDAVEKALNSFKSERSGVHFKVKLLEFFQTAR